MSEAVSLLPASLPSCLGEEDQLPQDGSVSLWEWGPEHPLVTNVDLWQSEWAFLPMQSPRVLLVALLHPCMKLCNSGEPQSKAEQCWRGRKVQGELSVHPRLVKLCAAFIVDSVPKVRGANASAWAIQDSWLMGINQTLFSVNPFIPSEGWPWVFCPDRKTAHQGISAHEEGHTFVWSASENVGH